MEIRFYYTDKQMQIFFSIFFILLGCCATIPSVLAFNSSVGSSGSDLLPILGLGIGFLISGTGFILFGVMRLKRNLNFYRNTPWTGLRLVDRTLICVSFNNWSLSESKINLDQVIDVKLNSNRGQRFLDFQMNGTKRHSILPVQRTSADEASRFVNQLRAVMGSREPIRFEIKEEQPKKHTLLNDQLLQIAEAFTRIAEKHFQISIERKINHIDEGALLIGNSESVEKDPCISVRSIGEGFGNTYSGYYEYQVIFELVNGPLDQGRPCLFKYSYESQDQAGSTSHFTTRMSEEDQSVLETDFYCLLREGVELPIGFKS